MIILSECLLFRKKNIFEYFFEKFKKNVPTRTPLKIIQRIPSQPTQKCQPQKPRDNRPIQLFLAESNEFFPKRFRKLS